MDPLHVDPDERRKMLTLKVFVSYTTDLPKVIADFIKHICINEIEFQNNTASLETYIASRLVSLDKNPGLPPTGVGKMLHRIAGKFVISIMKGGVMKAVWNSQLRGGQSTGCNAAVYSMYDIFATN